VKMDGFSMTLYYVDDSSKCWDHLHLIPSQCASRSMPSDNARFGVCSKNFDLFDNGENQNMVFWDAAMKSGIFSILRNVGRPLAVQGELVGWNINSNPHRYPKDAVKFFMYSIIDIEEGVRLDPRKVEQFAGKLGLLHVPVLGYVKIPEIAGNHQEILDRAEKRQGEGLVFKSCDDGRWFKVHSVSYLLAREEGGSTVVATPSYPLEFAPSVDSALPEDAKAVFEELFPGKKASAATPTRLAVPRSSNDPFVSPTANGSSPLIKPPPTKSLRQYWEENIFGPRAVPSPVADTTLTHDVRPEVVVNEGKSVSTPPTTPSPITERRDGSDVTPIRGHVIGDLKFDNPFDEMDKRRMELQARLATLAASPASSPDAATTVTVANTSKLALVDSPTAALVDTSNLPRNERIKAKMQALGVCKARVERLENGLTEVKQRIPMANIELMQRIWSSEDRIAAERAQLDSSPMTASTTKYHTAPEETPSEYHSLSDDERDAEDDDDSDAEYDDEPVHPVLEGMPRDGTAVIIGDPADPTGWRIKPEVMEARAAVWRQASIDRTLRADDGGLGTWIDEWATGFFGADHPKRPKDVNDVFFYIRPHEYLPEYRKERHPNLFPTESALMTLEASPTTGRRLGPRPFTISPSVRADAEFLGLI
jgi:hypothetical protein